jgi:2-keto-3-deoxy-6-phosphogluconate aldolase
MTTRTYEITFAGEAVPAIIDAFEDVDVVVGAGQTTLHAQHFDQAALHGALDRLRAFGLELLEVRIVD